MGSELIRKGFMLRGQVQGVGFRWWTRRRAEALGVRGIVENLDDGSVRIMAVAPPDVLAHFERDIAEGPPLSRVERLEEIPYELEADISDFSVRR